MLRRLSGAKQVPMLLQQYLSRVRSGCRDLQNPVLVAIIQPDKYKALPEKLLGLPPQRDFMRRAGAIEVIQIGRGEGARFGNRELQHQCFRLAYFEIRHRRADDYR